MTASTSPVPTSTAPLVEALATRLRCVDLIGWAKISALAEMLALSFESLRLLLALTTRDGPSRVKDFAHISGVPLHAAYPAVHDLRRRGYLNESRRRYSLSENGRDLVATLDAAHREGLQVYLDGLDAADRQSLDEAIRVVR